MSLSSPNLEARVGEVADVFMLQIVPHVALFCLLLGKLSVDTVDLSPRHVALSINLWGQRGAVCTTGTHFPWGLQSFCDICSYLMNCNHLYTYLCSL